MKLPISNGVKQQKNSYVVAITGASGVIYGIRLIESLVNLGENVSVILSPSAQIVIREELGIKLPKKQTSQILSKLFSKKILSSLTYYSYDDMTAPPASGSFQHKGMFVCPCSQATLSAIRVVRSKNLIERAADVCIKEGKPLVLVPLEMPLSALHLENMTALSQIGVKILPASPAFYHHPKSIDDLVDFVVGRALDVMKIEHEMYERWVKVSR